MDVSTTVPGSSVHTLKMVLRNSEIENEKKKKNLPLLMMIGLYTHCPHSTLCMSLVICIDWPQEDGANQLVAEWTRVRVVLRADDG